MKKKKNNLFTTTSSGTSSGLQCSEDCHYFLFAGETIPKGWSCLCGQTFYNNKKYCPYCGHKLDE